MACEIIANCTLKFHAGRNSEYLSEQVLLLLLSNTLHLGKALFLHEQFEFYFSITTVLQHLLQGISFSLWSEAKCFFNGIHQCRKPFNTSCSTLKKALFGHELISYVHLNHVLSQSLQHNTRTSYRNGRNTEALIIENLEPVEITKKLFQHHLNILRNVYFFKIRRAWLNY